MALSARLFTDDTKTSPIYTLPLHDALPISPTGASCDAARIVDATVRILRRDLERSAKVEVLLSEADRKSTRLNSSHVEISYAVFCLKKKRTSLYAQPLDLHTPLLSRDGLPC